MYFFRDRALAERFRKNEVPSWERFRYYILILILVTIISTKTIAHYWATQLNIWAIAIDAALLFLTVIGTYLCYTTNSKGDGREFIERMVCIGFPVLVQMLLLTLVFSVLATFIVGFVYGLDEGNIPADETIFDLIGVTFVIGYYYVRLNSSIRIASGIESNP